MQEQSFAAYLDELTVEAERARQLYDLLVVPGLELTWDDPDPALAGHALALGLRRFVGVGDGLEAGFARRPRARGGARRRPSVSARGGVASSPPHGRVRGRPVALGEEGRPLRALQPGHAASAGSRGGLPAVACGDFHGPEHLAAWKTLLPCVKDERGVIDYLRSPRPAFLVQLDPTRERLPRAA